MRIIRSLNYRLDKFFTFFRDLNSESRVTKKPGHHYVLSQGLQLYRVVLKNVLG